MTENHAADDANPATLVRNAIHNPSEPRHFMRVVPANRTVTALVGNAVIAASERSLVVKEVGRDIYDPVVYFPREDVNHDLLRRTEQTTHCPLKGDTEYFDVLTADGATSNAAWSYVTTIPEAEVLRGFVAFDTSHVTVA